MRKLLPLVSALAALTSLATLLCLLVVSVMPAPTLAAAGEGCPNEQVRQEGNTNPATGEAYSVGLPDCRAYEKVSPSEKQGHNIAGIDVAATAATELPAAPDGNFVAFGSLGALLPVQDFDSAGSNPYVAERTATGWRISYAQTPASLIASHTSDLLSDFSPSFSVQADCNLSAVSRSAMTCALREGVTGPWTHTVEYPLVGGEVLNTGCKFEVGSSSDLSHVVLQLCGPPPQALLSTDTLCCENGGGQGSLYEVEGLDTGSPVLRLVNVDSTGNAIGNSTNSDGDNPGIGGGGGGEPSDQYQAVSSDGAKIFFTSKPTGGVTTVYARVNHSETVAVSNPSQSECTTCNPTASPATYQGASADGSKVFFMTDQQLVNADTDKSNDLYEYDFENSAGHHLVQVSGGDIGDLTPGSGAEVQGVVRTSPDGSQVYFVAHGVLTTPPNADGESAIQGADNMYDFDTETNHTRFVAMLCSGSGSSGTISDAACPSASTATDAALWAVGDSDRQAQTTPDGRYLIFNTFARLINKATPGHEAEADEDEAQDVYRYDSQTGELIRISIGEPGFPASKNGNTPGMNALLGPIPGGSNAYAGALAGVNDWDRAISENGEFIVFETPERLQADDVNTGAEPACFLRDLDTTGSGCDIYEWHDGTVSMISDGHDPLGIRSVPTMSASGADVFFITHTALVPQDEDELADLYDARIDGGFPAPAAVPSCSGDACQGAQSPAPLFGPPGSLSLTGAGNLMPPTTVTTTLTESKPKSKTKALTRAQKLSKALTACRRKPKERRAECERQARKRYAAKPRKKAKKTDRGGATDDHRR